MIRSLTGLIHTLAAITALASGLVLFLRPKATLVHRILGYVYSLAMAVLITTAFFIFHLTGSINPLHFLAIVSIVPLAIGLFAAVTRTPRATWLSRHYYWMCWSFVGLCSAFAAEMSVRVFLPFIYTRMHWQSVSLFWTIVAIASSIVTFFGANLVRKNSALVQTFANGSARGL